MQNQNLFDFDYTKTVLPNLDGTTSRHFGIYAGNNLVATASKGYKIVGTDDLTAFAEAMPGNVDVSAFTHQNGGVIGLRMFIGERATKVGDIQYEAVLTVPNNGKGKGYLSIQETRLWCSNGAARLLQTAKSISIPHNLSYPQRLALAETAVKEFGQIIEMAQAQDTSLAEMPITPEEIQVQLARWFFEVELTGDHKKLDNGEEMTFGQFRERMFNEEFPKNWVDRYNALRAAYLRECDINEEHGLTHSWYTLYAAITNYLSRRAEKSKSKVPVEVKLVDQAKANQRFFDLVLAQ